ncbi:putative ribonuclease H-like domain-containing protein [Tanacetum coccineum]
MSNNSETDSEISLSVFYVRSSDEESTPANDRFSKADGYHAVPPPITGNFLTPRADISFAGLDEYAIRKKIIESKTTDLNTKPSETVGKTNEANTQKPKTVYESVNRDKVIIEDWNSDDEDDSQEPKMKTVVNTGPRVDKPVWDNTKRVNHQKISKNPHLRKTFVPTGVLTRTDEKIEDYNGGFVAFGSDPKGGKIMGKGKIRTANLEFDDVYFVDELKFNLLSVSQMCDKKNSVLFTESECLILSPSFKLLDESQVVLRAPRKDDVYSLDLKNIIPSGGITCLYANATADDSKLWHSRLGHVNFKNINKLVKGQDRKKSLKKKWMQKESVSKQGRKSAKSTPTAHTDQVFDDVDVNDAIYYMKTDAYMQKGVSTEDQVSTVKPDEGTDKPKVSTIKPDEGTDKPKVSTDKPEVSTDKLDEGTAEPKDGTSDVSTAPTTVFRDDETIAEFLVSMSQNKAKQKGVDIKDAEDSDRPRATSTRSVLTLKPLPIIVPKDKGKKVLEEEAESEGVVEAKRKKFDRLAKDEEIARKARIEVDRLLTARFQEEDREKFTVEERAKFLYDITVAQRRFLSQQRAAAIRSRPPTRTQLRNQMITYLKNVGGKKHVDLKNKNFEEIQVLYEKVKRSDKNFIAIGSAEDERQIKEMNEEVKDSKKIRVVKETPREEDTAKVPAKQEVTEQGTKKRKSGHVKMIARKRPKPQPDDDSDDEH